MNLSPRAQQLAALQLEKYLRSFPQKRKRLRDCWMAIERNGSTVELSADLKTEVHRLAGSAGSYGLDELSDAAQRVDLLLAGEVQFENLKAGAGNEMNALFHAIDQVIESLPDRFEAATSPREF
jgi:HPt (histidine-containing phosphotransfer) domain-containing protein